MSSIAPDIRNKEKQKINDASNLFGFFGQQKKDEPNTADQLGTFAKMGQQMGIIDKDSTLSQAAEGTQKMFGTAPPPPKKTGVKAIDTFNDYNQQLGTYADSAALANQFGVASGPLTDVASKAQPYQKKAAEYGTQAADLFEDGSLNWQAATQTLTGTKPQPPPQPTLVDQLGGIVGV